MDVVAELERARESHRRQAWVDACDAFQAIDGRFPLAIEDLERLAESAHILGRGDETTSVLQRVYQVRADAGDIGDAVRCAFYLWHASAAAGPGHQRLRQPGAARGRARPHAGGAAPPGRLAPGLGRADVPARHRAAGPARRRAPPPRGSERRHDRAPTRHLTGAVIRFPTGLTNSDMGI